MQSQSQVQLNVNFVVNVILKMGLPVFMADNEGFRKVSARARSAGALISPPRAQVCSGLLLVSHLVSQIEKMMNQPIKE